MNKLICFSVLFFLAIIGCAKAKIQYPTKPWDIPTKIFYSKGKKTVIQLVTNDKGDDFLRKRATDVTFPLDNDTQAFIANMRKFIISLDSPNGAPAGLAAPQIGNSKRIIFFQITPIAKKFRKNVIEMVPLTVLINPSYKPITSEGKSLDWEGCYSVPDKMGEVERYNAIKYQGYNEQGKKITGTARGLLARILQHEIDHVNGTLYIDLVTKGSRFGSFDEMRPIRMKELEEYLRSKP